MAETAASSWSLDENDYKRILEHMNALLQESSARCALLVDRAGQLVATAGEQPQFDSTAFASLTAADFSANDQLAKMIGEAEFASLVHQGQKESMFLADVGKRVIVSGLDTDFMGRPFEPMPRLLAVAEEINKLLAICVRCGNPAVHTQRLVASEDLIVVGATGMYEARCRRCHSPEPVVAVQRNLPFMETKR